MNNYIDISARKRLCGLMRQFAIGRITNDDFDEAFENINTKDQALYSIATATFAYFNEYVTVQLTGKYRLSREHRKSAARWILFLQSGQQYKNYGLSLPATLRGIACALTGGRIAKGQENEAYEEHERLVWPFATQTDLDEARRHPKLMCGAR